MKDYCRIAQEIYVKAFYNEKNQYHRLTGPAFEWSDGNKSFYINDIGYMGFDKYNNELFITPEILELISQYEKYIKQNVKDLMQGFNPEIKLYEFTKEKINHLPNWIKDLIILCKDFCKIQATMLGTYFYNDKKQIHRLNGLAEILYSDDYYWINHIRYMLFDKLENNLYVYINIIKLFDEYNFYIKQNINTILGTSGGVKIKFINFSKKQIKQLPNWLKDLLIL